MHCAEGVSAPGGCLLQAGGVPALGGLLPGGSAPGGVCSWGDCLLRGEGGVCSQGVCSEGGGIPACTEADLPPPLTEFLTHATENITLPQTSFPGGKKSKVPLTKNGDVGGTCKQGYEYGPIL